MKVLVATIGFGSGHNKAAEAVAETVPSMFPGSEVRVVDFLEWKRNIRDSLTISAYFNAIKYVPSVYHALYQWASSKKALHPVIFRPYISKMERYLRDYPADVIISTHVFCARASASLKEKNPAVRTIWGYLTDFLDDRYWNTLKLDMFFVATEELKAKLLGKGVPEENVTIAPLPVKKEFLQKKEKKEACRRIKARLKPEAFTILILGGGNGLGDIYEVTKCLIVLPIQVIVVAGINNNLRERLTELRYSNANLHIFGYVNNVYDLMDASDACVTKPGGMTIAECMAKGLPMIIYGKPLPGPETENIDYLVSKKSAEFYSTLHALREGVSRRLPRQEY
ncbi:MAG: hypothetical protein HY887_00950 [Deltaproteobacteria bacterium]|nr:hypothetical protein [Deltaproteobacteria bacterium]